MNSRIKELIEQATSNEEFYPAGCNGHPDYRVYFDKEKFAELLVRKCIQLCNSEDDSWVKIVQHFGVDL